MQALRSFVALTGLVATTVVAVACGGGEPPELVGLEDQEVAVGNELVIELIGTDPDGDELTYSFSADVPDIDSRAGISRRPDGVGLFRWTPLAADVGPWFFDFSVSDGSNSETVTIQIEVKSAIGVNSAPVFREPLGTGTTLDLNVADCVDVGIVIEDQDSTSVAIGQEDPLIDGAQLIATGGLTAAWTWCPAREQIEADDRYTLVLSADDQTNPMTVKHYLIVLRKVPQTNCPGDPPVVTHTPMNESTLTGLTIDATISDDAGLKAEPLLYYSETQPSDPPDLGAMTQVTMLLITGDMQSGTWAADVPNPVAGQSMGSQATLYYFIVAQDNDDVEGDCDHLTQAPSSGSFQMTVTNPGGQGGAGVCEPCTGDVQCGGANDLCVRVGTGGESFCLKECSGPSDCPTDYTCSTGNVESVDMAMGRQCVPNSNDCSNPGGTVCMDDAMEDNDSRTEASTNPVLDPGQYNLVSCEADIGDDEDWFQIDVSSDADVTLTLAGSSASDLDLALYDVNGALIKSSVTLTSNEMVQECLTPGIYYIRVYAYGAEENPYTLTYSQTSMSCSGPTCTDDDQEDDDNSSQARVLAFSDIYPDPFTSLTNAICAGDDDWFRVSMVDGDTITVDLTFEQTNSSEDLDLHFLNAALTDLTPCTEANPSTCSTSQGQSVSSNEHYEHTESDPSCTISEQCIHYIFVHGWNGAENLYDISVQLSF